METHGRKERIQMRRLGRSVAICSAALLAVSVVLSGCAGKGQEESETKETEVVESGQDGSETGGDATGTETGDAGQSESTQTEGRITVDGTNFVIGDEIIYMNGVNTPWDNWNDLGGDFDEAFWQEHFAELHENGINASRVWISCNGDVAFDIDENGYVSGVSDAYWEDLDTLLSIAEENDIYIMATLMSFDNFKNTNVTYMSWRAMVQDEEAIDSYVDNFVIPLCEKFNHYDSLFSIDLCNEPDWIVENEEDGKLAWKDLGNLFSREAAAIHENSDILVTIGFAMSKYNSDKYQGNYGSDKFLQSCYNNENAYLDYYSPHFYEWEAPWFNFPFDKTPTAFGMDGTKPVVIGEFPATGMTSATSGSKDMTGSECYIGLYENGWNGGFAWTSNGVDSCGSLSDFAEGANAVAEKMNEN